jgi:hypothetical protein
MLLQEVDDPDVALLSWQDGVEVEALVDAQARLGEAGEALAERLVLVVALVRLGHCILPDRAGRGYCPTRHGRLIDIPRKFI